MVPFSLIILIQFILKFKNAFSVHLVITEGNVVVQIEFKSPFRSILNKRFMVNKEKRIKKHSFQC